MNKKLINMPKLIFRLWISLWIVLIILVIMKLLFNTWYPIVIENKFLLNIFNWFDAHVTIRYIINCLFYCINSYFIYNTATKRKHPKLLEFIIIMLLTIANNILKNYNNTLGVLGEIIIAVVIPIVYNIKFKTFNKLWINILFPVILNIILALWQLNILFIRNINDLLKYLPTVISYTLQLDYYIFLIITWIGVVYIMSTLGFWFFGKSLTELKEIKEKELAKEEPDKELIAELDKKIEELEAKGE